MNGRWATCLGVGGWTPIQGPISNSVSVTNGWFPVLPHLIEGRGRREKRRVADNEFTWEKSMKTYFIGGPWNGKSLDLDVTPETYIVTTQYQYIDPETGIPDELLMPITHEYRLNEVWDFGGNNIRVYIQGSMSNPLQYLLDEYCVEGKLDSASSQEMIKVLIFLMLHMQGRLTIRK